MDQQVLAALAKGVNRKTKDDYALGSLLEPLLGKMEKIAEWKIKSILCELSPAGERLYTKYRTELIAEGEVRLAGWPEAKASLVHKDELLEFSIKKAICVFPENNKEKFASLVAQLDSRKSDSTEMEETKKYFKNYVFKTFHQKVTDAASREEQLARGEIIERVPGRNEQAEIEREERKAGSQQRIEFILQVRSIAEVTLKRPDCDKINSRFLTEREEELIRLLASGMTYKQITKLKHIGEERIKIAVKFFIILLHGLGFRVDAFFLVCGPYRKIRSAEDYFSPDELLEERAFYLRNIFIESGIVTEENVCRRNRR
jgi:ATP/maltotriose-dependent transcriptional regulator MalT